MIVSARWCARRACLVLVLVLALVLVACGTMERASRPDDTESLVRPTDLALTRQWVADGPREPKAIVADRSGAVGIGWFGDIVSLDPDGRRRWRTMIAADGEQTFGPAALGRDAVLVAVTPGRVVALDRSTGDEQWSVPVDDPLDVGIDPGPRPAAAVVTTAGMLELREATDGALRWSVALGFGESAGVTRVWLDEQSVVVGWGDVTGTHIDAFDVASGVRRWGSVSPLWGTPPTISGDAVLVAENLEQLPRRVIARVRRLDLGTGEEVWARSVDGPFLMDLEVAVDQDAVIVVDVAGRLTALDAETGSVRWRARTGKLQYAADPEIVGDMVAMTTYGTGLLARARVDGAPVANDEPGAVQLAVTLEGSAAAGRRLYLLGGRSRGAGEVWMLSASG